MKLDPHVPPQGTIRDWLEARAATQGAEISHIFPDEDRQISWAELCDEAQTIAARLAGLGAKAGNSVALVMPNGRNAVLGLFGALYGGFRATMINLVAGPEAIGYALEHSDARLALVAESQLALVEKAMVNNPAPPQIIVGRDGFDWPADSLPSQPGPHGPDSDALLMYTSGTTGRPKGVVHSHASLLAGGWTTALAHDLTQADRALCVLPVYHINGLCVTIIAPLVSGGASIVCERFSAGRFWPLCDQHGATWFSVVPTIISHLLQSETMLVPATRARIRFGRSASAPLAPEVQTAFETRFGIAIVETMGLTETAAQILSNPLPPGLRKIGSPGTAIGNEVAIMAPDMSPQAHGTEGEICVRGPNVMTRYLHDMAATAAALTPQGWLRTGDLGRMDAEGFVFVTGRSKELIIKGGENIAPREIDEALYAHPDVIEAAAFARKCARYGERVEAAVALRKGSMLRIEDLNLICEQRLGKFKSPDVIHLMDELPKGPSGKIQRLRLAQMTE